MAGTGKGTKLSGMNEIREDIREKHFRRVYLLYGEEEYLVQQYRRELIRAVCKDGDSMNLNIHRDDSLDWGAVQDEILSMPFFAERRMVVLDDTKLFRINRKKAADPDEGDEEAEDPDAGFDAPAGDAADNSADLSAAMAAFLPKIPDSTVVLFTEHADEKKLGGQKGKTSVDRRSRLFKAVAKSGLAVEFSSPDEAMLRKWVMGKLGAKKIRITSDTLDTFLAMTGTDMSHISTETEKLVSFAGEGGIVRREDVMALTSEILEGKVFRMLDMISQGERREALDLYADLIALKEPETRILVLMMRQFRQLLTVRTIMDDGGSFRRVMEEAGISKNWQAEKAMRQAGGYSRKRLREILEECVRMQEKIQSGRFDRRLGVELLIMNCAKKGQ